MRNINFFKIFGTIIFINVWISANTQTLDDILQKHFEHINISAKDKIQSIKYTGKFLQFKKELPFDQIIKKPDKNRVNVIMMGDTSIQSFDGEKAWMIAPWLGSKLPQDLASDQLKSLKDQIDINGALYHWEQKGYNLELIGIENTKESNEYKLKLTKNANDISYHYIDNKTFLISKIIAISDSNTIIAETHFSDYRKVDGIKFPFQIAVLSGGQVFTKIIIESIELNINIEDGYFSRPEGKSE